MEAWEMSKKAKDSLKEKMSAFYGEREDKKPPVSIKYDSYEEAHEEGDVRCMIQYKMSAYREKRDSVIAKSNEIYNTKSISEILGNIEQLEETVKTNEETVQLLHERQEKKFRREYSKIGGLVGIHLDAAVYDAMKDWEQEDEQYLQAVADYKAVKNEYVVYCNAEEMYIEDHKEMIEEEQKKAEREELLASGILERVNTAPQSEGKTI
jgi:hypothetical protein